MCFQVTQGQCILHRLSFCFVLFLFFGGVKQLLDSQHLFPQTENTSRSSFMASV